MSKSDADFGKMTELHKYQQVSRHYCSYIRQFVTIYQLYLVNNAYLRIQQKQTPKKIIDMKKFYYLLLVLLCIGCSKDDSPREGDIIFQTQPTALSSVIQTATQSEISHCGIIVQKEDGLYYVLHADRRTHLTPLSTYISRGFKDKYSIKRATNKKVKIDYKKYLGKEEDIRMQFNNDRYYNAELVYHIYLNDLGIELCQPRRIDSYNIKGMEGMLMERGIRPNQEVVAPADLYNSAQLSTIRTLYKEAE